MVAFRAAAEDDLEAVLALYADPDLDAGKVLDIDAARRLFARMHTYPSYRLYVGELGGEIVATFTLLIMDNLAHCGSPSAVMEAVVVRGDHRGSGVGRAMVAYALRLCHQAGCYKLALSSNRRRDAAHRFYEGLGFARHGYSFAIDLAERGDGW